jgi:hypothetical protein
MPNCSHPKDAEKETKMDDPNDATQELVQVTCDMCGSWLRGETKKK